MRRVEEGERAEDREAGLVAGAAGGVVRQAAAEADVVRAVRPRQRVGELRLAAEQIRDARLADRERHRAGARVGGRQLLRFPQRDRVAVQIRERALR